MNKLIISDKIYVGLSKIANAGRGVFAKRDIKKGEIIETCPIIEIPKYDMSNLRKSILVTYFFYFGENKEQLVIALGFGSIYNHTHEPNATYKEKLKEKIIEFVALKDIKKNKEITFNYSQGNQESKDPLWFNSTT